MGRWLDPQKGLDMLKAKLFAAGIVTYACVSLYPTAGVVTSADLDTAMVRTVHGHVYEITNTDCDYYVGDAVALIMTDNATPNDLTDDTPIVARYIGGTDCLLLP